MNKYLSYSLQLIFFVGLYLVIEFWQTRNLLPDDGSQQAPQFSLVGMDGKVYKSSKLNKLPTVIYFFAPWCKVCHFSIPNLQNLFEDTARDQLNVMAVVLDWQNKEEVSQYIKDHNLTMPVLLGTTQTMQDFKIQAFPTYYVLDKNQKITKVSMGYSTELGLRINTP
jgi:peroxiredoxin